MGSLISGRVRIRLVDGKLMRRRSPPFVGAAWYLTASAVLTGCGPSPRDAAFEGPIVEVVDAADRRHVLPSPVRRIVSLVPSATETLRAIGADGALVGRTDFDAQEWAEHLPSVGGGLGPSLETIVALAPDVVIGFAGDQDPRTSERLTDLGIPFVAVRPERIEDIFDTADLLGRMTGHQAGADSLVRSLRTELDAIAAAVSEWPRVRVAHVLGGSPPWVTGPDTYIGEVLELVGGENVFSDLEALYAAISPEELRVREIDVVLVAGRGEYDESLTRGARIEAIGSDLEIPGPDVAEAARRVAERVHERPIR